MFSQPSIRSMRQNELAKRVLAGVLGGVLLLNPTTIVYSYNSTLTITGGLGEFGIDYSLKNPSKTPAKSLDFVIASTANAQNSTENNNNGTSVGANVMGPNSGGLSFSGIVLSEDDRRHVANTIMHEIGISNNDTWDGNPETNPKCNVACCIFARLVTDFNDFKNQKTVAEVILAPNQFSGIRADYDRHNYATEDCYKAIDYVLEHGNQIGQAYFYATPKAARDTRWFSGEIAKGRLIFQFTDGYHNYYKPYNA